MRLAHANKVVCSFSVSQSGFPIPGSGPPRVAFLLALLAVPKRAPALEFPDGDQLHVWPARSLTAATGAHEEFCDLVVGGSPISVHPYIYFRGVIV